MINFDSDKMDRVISKLNEKDVSCLETLTQTERKALKVAIKNLVDKDCVTEIDRDILDEIRYNDRVEVLENDMPSTTPGYLDTAKLASFIKKKATEFKMKQMKQHLQILPQEFMTDQVWKAKGIWGEMRPHLVQVAEQFKLSSDLLDQVQKQYIDNPEALQNTPKATQGLKAEFIIIPNDLPIVIRIKPQEHGNRFMLR